MENVRYYVLHDETFGTQNPLEIVAYILRNKQTNYPNDAFWNLPLVSWSRSDIPMAIYWLSGGDAEWRFGTYYTLEWPDAVDFYCNYFTPMFHVMLEECKTFGDLLRIYRKRFNMAVFYEFGLAYGSILRREN